MANVLFKRGNTTTINGTAIADGQLLYNTTTGQHYIDSDSTRKEVGKPVDTTLSTTSTNAIANNALTNSIINTTAEVSAITADNIPCGTKPVKELINSLNSIGTSTLLASTSSATFSTFTVSNLSNFRYLYMICENTNNGFVQSSAIVPTDIFRIYNSTSKYFMTDDQADHGVVAYYISDTSIALKTVKEFRYAKIYGIK